MGLKSVKFKYTSRSVQLMINRLNQNQNLLRYIKYLTFNPLDNQSYDNITNDLINQPDFELPYDLIDDGVVDTRLFNPTIMKDRLVKIFFCHKRTKFEDPKALSHTIYSLSIVVPWEDEVIPATRDNRTERIADEIASELDNQVINGVSAGKIFVTYGESYVVNNKSSYCGLDLYILVENTTKYVPNKEN